MRVLLFILVIFTYSVAAQSVSTLKAFNEGTLNARSGEFEKALENYRQANLSAVSENSNDNFLAQIHFNTGVCLFRLQHTEKAVEEFDQAIKLSRGSHQKSFYALGMAHSELKNWREAERAFLKATQLKKTDGEAWFDLALVYLGMRNLQSAEEAFQNSIEYGSINRADAHNNLGVIYAVGNDLEAAMKEFEIALLDSKGASLEAQNNLQFCRYYKNDLGADLIAKLSFSKTNINLGENNG